MHLQVVSDNPLVSDPDILMEPGQNLTLPKAYPFHLGAGAGDLVSRNNKGHITTGHVSNSLFQQTSFGVCLCLRKKNAF